MASEILAFQVRTGWACMSKPATRIMEKPNTVTQAFSFDRSREK